MANERAGWLFSRTQDLLVWTIPVVFTGVAYVLSLWIRAPEHAVIGRALWATQFILGNTTHVVLTFLLLGARRDILHACQGQAARTIVGSVSTLLLAFFAFWFTREAVPWFANFGTAIAICFATHHTLSQARGIWSLYGLRIQTATGGVPAFPLERRLFSGYVSLGTLLILVRWFFTPAVSSGAAFFPAFPGARAELPAEAILLLLAIWLVYAAAVVVSMRATLGWGVRTPKLVYVLLHLCGVAVTLVSPLWGAVYLGGLHGMEYIFLCRRMLRSTQGESQRIDRWIIPIMVVAMTPLMAVGVLDLWSTQGALRKATDVAIIAMDAIVMAHYFADACIYRFRIPAVRHVALNRLGFR